MPSLEQYVQRAVIPVLNTTYGYYTKRPEYILDTEISISDAVNVNDYFLNGISGIENDFLWTDGTDMQMIFLFSEPINTDLELCLDLKNIFNNSQRVMAEAAGMTLFEEEINEAGIIYIPIPEECVQNNQLIVSFHLIDAVSPAELGMSEDARILSLAISSFTMHAK